MTNLKATLLKSRTLTYEIEIDVETARHYEAKRHHITVLTGVDGVAFTPTGNIVVTIINHVRSDILLDTVLHVIEDIKN